MRAADLYVYDLPIEYVGHAHQRPLYDHVLPLMARAADLDAKHSVLRPTGIEVTANERVRTLTFTAYFDDRIGGIEFSKMVAVRNFSGFLFTEAVSAIGRKRFFLTGVERAWSDARAVVMERRQDRLMNRLAREAFRLHGVHGIASAFNGGLIPGRREIEALARLTGFDIGTDDDYGVIQSFNLDRNREEWRFGGYNGMITDRRPSAADEIVSFLDEAVNFFDVNLIQDAMRRLGVIENPDFGLEYSAAAIAVGSVHDRGIELLKQHLTPSQREQYETTDAFDVIGGKTGTRYRIVHGGLQNVFVLDANLNKVSGLCFYAFNPTPFNICRAAVGGMPPVLAVGDSMLAQKFTLELNEDEALRIAHRF